MEAMKPGQDCCKPEMEMFLHDVYQLQFVVQVCVLDYGAKSISCKTILVIIYVKGKRIKGFLFNVWFSFFLVQLISQN